MQLVAVTSTTIFSIGYDAETSALEIQFRRGTKYRYFLVPTSTYDAFRDAPSKGAFFQRQYSDTLSVHETMINGCRCGKIHCEI
jgi:lysyl-tRNA synthetase class 2